MHTVKTVTSPILMSESTPLIRRMLQANVAFSVISGLVFTFASDRLATFSGTAGRTLLGFEAATIIMEVGIMLLAFAGFVFYVSRTEPLAKRLVWTIIVLDAVWVVDSVALILTGALGLTTAANWTVLGIADIVLAFAVLEVIGLRRYNNR